MNDGTLQTLQQIRGKAERILRPEFATYVPFMAYEIIQSIDELIEKDKTSWKERRSLKRKINDLADKVVDYLLKHPDSYPPALTEVLHPHPPTELKSMHIHILWLEEGGLTHDQSSVEDLKQKVDWIYATFPAEACGRDTRKWKPAPRRSGDEPMLSQGQPGEEELPF